MPESYNAPHHFRDAGRCDVSSVLAAYHLVFGRLLHAVACDLAPRAFEDDHEELRRPPEISGRGDREVRDARVLVVVALLGDVVEVLERYHPVGRPRAR